MSANLRKIMGEVPRPFELMDQETKANPTPLNSKPVSEREQMSRLEPLMGLIAHGHVPLDDNAARAVASYVNGFHKRVR